MTTPSIPHSSTHGVLGLGTQLLSIKPEQVRCRDANKNTDEAQHTVTPPVAQGGIHIRSEEREPEPGQTAQEDDGSHTTGREAGVRVDDIRLHTLQTGDGSRGEDGDADVRHDPVQPGLRAPAVPEEADGDEQRSDEHGGYAELGPAFSWHARGSPARGSVRWSAGGPWGRHLLSRWRVVAVRVVAFTVAVAFHLLLRERRGLAHLGVHLGRELLVQPVGDLRVDLRPEEEAQAQRDVVQAADAEALAVHLSVEGREGRQDQVEEAEQVAHVHGDDLHDGLGGQQP